MFPWTQGEASSPLPGPFKGGKNTPPPPAAPAPPWKGTQPCPHGELRRNGACSCGIPRGLGVGKTLKLHSL